MSNSSRPDLLAEAYFLTEFSGKDQPLEHFFLSSQGTKERGRNREVLDSTTKSGVVDEEFIHLQGLEVSRNGIYDLLPEAIFFPLSLGPLNTPDIIDQIKANREKEEDARLFFMPFDSEMFLFKAQLLQEELFSSDLSDFDYLKFLRGLGLAHNPLVKVDKSYLFPFLLNSFDLQEKPTILEGLLTHLLDSEVHIYTSLAECTPQRALGLGMGRLGVDTILSGPLILEEDDWIVEIKTDKPQLLEQAGRSQELDDAIIELLEFFVIARREIHINWIALQKTHDPVLGSGRLGYSTII